MQITMQTCCSWLNKCLRRFRWTDLQIKRLLACPTADEFRDALDTIPKTLEDTYHLALGSVAQNHQKHVRQVLIWLTSSLRELTSSEVAAAVSFPFVEDVLRICTSVLITVIDGDTRETVKLAHFTVKEFLIVREGCEEGLHWYRFTARLANRCIATQAMETVFGDPPAESRNLLRYANQFWPAHARQNDAIPGCTASDELQSKINSLFECGTLENLLSWLWARYPTESPNSQGAPTSLQPLYYASLLGLQRSVAQLWHSCSQLDQHEGFYGNALNAAACMGHADVVMWLTDRIDNPADHFNLPQIVRYLRLNVGQTLRALLQKGSKTAISSEIVYAMQMNPVGQEVLRICLEENLTTISITEELVKAAACNKWNRKIVDVLVECCVCEFPVDLRTLLTIAETSLSALQTLINSRKEDISFHTLDFLALTQEKSAYTTQKLTSLGVIIPITTDLINALASSPAGSQILKLLLDKQTIEHPLPKSDVLTVAKGFNLDTFEALLRHEWEDNDLTEELILAIAFNCYLDPSVAAKIPEREFRADGSVHRTYRPTLKQSTKNDSSRALMSLLTTKDLNINLTERIVAHIAKEYTRDVVLHLVNKLVGEPICGSNAVLCDYHRFSALLRLHSTRIGVSTTVLRVLEESYTLMSTHHLIMDERWTRFISGFNAATPAESHLAAALLGVESLPTALLRLEYSTSEYEKENVVHVQRGWRVPQHIDSGHDRLFDYRDHEEGTRGEAPGPFDSKRDFQRRLSYSFT